jgi:hypothetical protein
MNVSFKQVDNGYVLDWHDPVLEEKSYLDGRDKVSICGGSSVARLKFRGSELFTSKEVLLKRIKVLLNTK